MEFYHNAIVLRREITMLLLRDFGIKDKVRSIKALYGVQGMEPEDEKKFREIIEKYELTAKIIEEYPAWLIDKMCIRDRIGAGWSCPHSFRGLYSLRTWMRQPWNWGTRMTLTA